MNLITPLSDGPLVERLESYFTWFAILSGIGVTLLFTALWGFVDLPIIGNMGLRFPINSTRLRVGALILAVVCFAAAFWMLRHFVFSVLHPQ